MTANVGAASGHGEAGSTYQMDMMPVLISSLQQGDIGVTSQVVHYLYLTPHILHIFC